MEEIRDHIGATTLAYLSTEAMVAATGRPRGRLCRACFDGDYPIPGSSEKFALENRTHYAGTRADDRSSYEAAGVSIERGEQAVDLMRSAVEATHGPEVLGSAGASLPLRPRRIRGGPRLDHRRRRYKVLVAREMGGTTFRRGHREPLRQRRPRHRREPTALPRLRRERQARPRGRRRGRGEQPKRAVI